MRNLDKYFENRIIDFEKLLKYGFVETNNIFSFEQKICHNRFKVIILISNEKRLSKVMDLTTDEEYVLVDINTTVGDFIGKVREAYENVLADFLEKCTVMNIFKSEQAKMVIKYIKDRFDDDLEYLWKKFPNNAIWRNKTNKKWYGALLKLEEQKLGIASSRIIEIINLRYPKNKIKEIIDNNRILPGYHMNKDNWITIRLDDRIDIYEIYELIDNSYNLSLEK